MENGNYCVSDAREVSNGPSAEIMFSVALSLIQNLFIVIARTVRVVLKGFRKLLFLDKSIHILVFSHLVI